MLNEFVNFPTIWSQMYDHCYENYKGLTKNPKWLLMRKMSRFEAGRNIMKYLSYSSVKSHQLSLTNKDSIFPQINIDEAVTQLKKEGFYLNLQLPKKIVREIVEFAKNTACYGNRKSQLGFYYHQRAEAEAQLKKNIKVGCYFNTAELCPAISKLQNDSQLLAIAAKYLEKEPIHQGNQLWWSFAGESSDWERRQNAQMFHYDLDDYRFLKFFFYLTDVDNTSGPHICVRGSHKHKKFSHVLMRKREKDREIIEYYGEDSFVTICGEAGFGFVEDPLCFHKGLTPTEGDRLLLQIEFATTDYGMQNDNRDTSNLQVLN
ncbi:MAG: phytanoyl-CoA dioxygenase family protein [Rivularia sp. (in: Bacteria)]|nr:phytanoyl-CoA dioxygenase family protein [Rivularia sp. MS3]